MTRLTLVLIALALLAPVASAQRDGRTLLEWCNQAVANDDGVKQDIAGQQATLACVGYVGGYLDAFAISHAESETLGCKKQLFCPPSDLHVNGTMQTARIFVKYLRAHPEELHEGAGVLLTYALQEAFRCKQQPRPQ